MSHLVGPIYDVETKHHFSQIQEKATGKPSLLGPVYKLDRKHHFSELPHKFESPQNLQGPLYDIPDPKHHYREILKHVDR